MSAGAGPLEPEPTTPGTTVPETPTSGARGEPASPETEQIQRDIEQTREQLGNTVEALAAKSDVKAQAQQKVEETKAAVMEKKDELLGKARAASPESAGAAASNAAAQARENPLPVAAVGAFVGGFLFGRVTKRRR